MSKSQLEFIILVHLVIVKIRDEIEKSRKKSTKAGNGEMVNKRK